MQNFSLGDPDRIVRLMPHPGLASRLVRILAETVLELRSGVPAYLRAAFLPDRIEDWFWLRLARKLSTSLVHPIDTLNGAFAPDNTGFKRRRWFIPVLATSATTHGVLIVYFVYLAFFSPYAHVRVVNKAYRQFDANAILEKLYYPPQILRLASRGQAMTLEEIRARAEKHKQELARAREKAEKEKKEKEEAERKAAVEAAKLAAEKKPVPKEFGEINEAPIKDTVGKLYELYQAGGLDVPDMKMSMMAGFKVEPDGSLSNIHMIKKSPSKLVDQKALEILWNIGESHALGPVSDLSSATISLDVSDDIARLRITAFAQTPEIAKAKSDLLNVLFWALRMKEKSPDIAQLLSLIKVRNDGKRVDTDLIVPRAKAAEMLRARFEHPGNPPQ
ncbi:MAG TPA: hypothetical protein VLM38_03030 [Blastocatellia bacterium]|nr:hypothetical protein [Blastocatellia bacterium]